MFNSNIFFTLSQYKYKMGKVYVASMKMRGKWAKRPQNTKIVNVTSMQAKQSQLRRDFSPMSLIQGGYKGFCCFENYWQAGKVYRGIDRQKQLSWWRNQKKGRRRYPKAKGIKPQYAQYNGSQEILNYIQSRKRIYVPQYFEIMKKTESFQKLSKDVADGQDVVVYDFDGPRDNKDGGYMCVQVTEQLLKSKINDPSFPFGHGYIVAGALIGIQPKDYL